MKREWTRRHFFQNGTLAMGAVAAGVGLTSSANASISSKSSGKIKIIGINGSPRRGKTTAQALGYALEAARAVSPESIETELIELTDYALFDSERVFGPSAVKGNGSFSKLEEKLADPQVRGIIVGSPVHNSMIAVPASAFFAQITHTVLQGKVGGALAVGGARNGGQESVVTCLNTYLFHEGVLLPGTGKSGRIGALLWNQKDSVSKDEFGIKLAKILGERIAKVAQVVPHDLLN